VRKWPRDRAAGRRLARRDDANFVGVDQRGRHRQGRGRRRERGQDLAASVLERPPRPNRSHGSAAAAAISAQAQESATAENAATVTEVAASIEEVRGHFRQKLKNRRRQRATIEELARSAQSVCGPPKHRAFTVRASATATSQVESSTRRIAVSATTLGQSATA